MKKMTSLLSFLAVVLVFATICILSPIIASGAELSKPDATKLLTLMGFNNLAVAAVINGVGAMELGASGGMPGAFSSPNLATVIAYGELNGQGKEIRMTFYYDKDISWFYFEVAGQKKAVKLWTLKGYTEVKATTP